MKKIYNFLFIGLLGLMSFTFVSAQDGYTDDCSAITSWSTNTFYSLSQSAGVVTVDVNKTNQWAGL